MLRLLRSSICLVALAAVTPARAQVRSDTTIRLPEATVTADRDRSSSAASVTRITALDVDDAVLERSRSLADLLDTSTGLYIRRYGPSGSAGVAFRGTDPNQTEILLDGLRITDPQSGQVDLSLIPVVLLESVEILHGTGSSSESSGGLGGTVKLHTVAAEPSGHARVRVSSGAYGRRSVSGLASGGSDLVSGLIAVEHSEEDGRFPYLNDALQPPARTIRAGADVEAMSVLAKASIRGASHRATIASWLNSVERGLPGPGNAPPVPSRQTDDHFRTWINTHHVFPGATISTDWAVQTSELRYTNKTNSTDDRTRTTSVEGRVGGNMPVGRSSVVQIGGNWMRNATRDVAENRVAGVASVANETPGVLLEASLRGEAWFAESHTHGQLVPRAGINVKSFLDPSLRLKASVGRTWTVPSLIDRYWVPGGNPGLTPEHGWSGDVGLHFTAGRFELETTGFLNKLKDRIVWIPSLVGSGVQVWRPTNIGEVHSYGLETSASGAMNLTAASRLSGSVTVTYTEARDRSDPSAVAYGHQIRYTPRTVAGASAAFLTGGVEVGLSGQLVGRRYITSDETSSLPAYAVFGGRASYRMPIGPVSAMLSATVENMLDASYSTIRFYPMPPRHFGFGLNLEWRPKE